MGDFLDQFVVAKNARVGQAQGRERLEGRGFRRGGNARPGRSG